MTARKRVIPLLVAAIVAVAASVIVVQAATAGGLARHGSRHHRRHRDDDRRTATPIRHLVVIFGENISFDHYFGTYPDAANTDGQTFRALPGTPAVNGLAPATDPSLPPAFRHSENLLTANPNSVLPQRLVSTPTGASGRPGGQLTCDQDHSYSDEQKAFDDGKMDKFVESVGTDGGSTSPAGAPCEASAVMEYYDGTPSPACGTTRSTSH